MTTDAHSKEKEARGVQSSRRPPPSGYERKLGDEIEVCRKKMAEGPEQEEPVVMLNS